MPNFSSLTQRLIQRTRSLLGRSPLQQPTRDEEALAGPLRGVLLGADQLAARAREVARGQRLASERATKPARLLARLEETRVILSDIHDRLREAGEREVDVSPAGEWLLDNYYVVEEQLLEVRESLPRGYYRELPELSHGSLAGYPRVYEIATTLISHTEGRVDLTNTEQFVGAFQEVRTLTIGELWAIPAMLRLGLIESVRRQALRTVQWLDEVERADAWARRIHAANEAGGEALGEALREFIAAPEALTPIFAARFLSQLRIASGAFPPLVWLEQWLNEEGIGADESAAWSTQRIALTQLMMANSITSLRAVARRDWQSFVERQSAIERILRDDPATMYARQDFESRDRYRHVVERIAKRTKRSESEIARGAIDLARTASNAQGPNALTAHVGYYLVDDGLADLEEMTGYRPPVRERASRWVRRHHNLIFFGAVSGVTAAMLAALFWLGGDAAREQWLIVLLIGLIPANDIAINVVNQFFSQALSPAILEKLDLTEHGIPEELRTVVVIPTLFGSVDVVRETFDHLEVQYLANQDDHLRFAVLSDFTDAPVERQGGDAAIVAAAVEHVNALNAQYANGANDVFYLFHRDRQWNPSQGVWMGWERKRGKLAQFNQFLRGRRDNAFSTIVGDVSRLAPSRYVITLDADTVLPPNAAAQLIGAIAHPLNRAVYDEGKGRIVRGYGVVQPRVGVSLPSAHRSPFAWIHSGHPGVDPYTTAVSDVYQDLFGEGSFTGKGIYDVDAFEQATFGRFPENRLLSHDLIEGNYARAGLATDITLYDDYPSRYLTFTRRKQRWVRGDWQLLQWITRRVPGPGGTEPNRLSMLSRWKLFDNLRRSLVELAQLAFFIVAWTVLDGSPLRWTLLGVGAVAAPWVASLLFAVVRPPFDKSWRAYYAAVLQDARTSAQQLGQALTFLPHQAWISAEAILRTLYRLWISKRHLLEWQTASQAERSASGEERHIWVAMRPAIVLSLTIFGVAIGLALWRAGILGGGAATAVPSANLVPLIAAMTPLVALWCAAPAIAHRLSSPSGYRERRLAPAQQQAMLRYALLHWHFFDTFVTEETNWLAPDNVQTDPNTVTAMRTSPTNIGLQLLSAVSAYELGFITVDDMTRRLERAFGSLGRMARFQGHFYNWYDLHDLRVLEPAYISTVDSGNMAGHLLALRQACLAIPEQPVLDPRLWRALAGSISLARERLLASSTREGVATRKLPGVAESDEALREALRLVVPLTRFSTRAADAGDTTREDGERGTAARDDAAHDPVSSLPRVADILRRARAAVDVARLTTPNDTSASSVTAAPEAHARSAIEWIDWSLAIAEAQAARLRALGLTSAGSLRDANGVRVTLRQLAARSPETESLIRRLELIAEQSRRYVEEMSFRFLYDESRELLTIGYQTASRTRDASFYDLLASEARLASFLAIAKNEAPTDHWFRLGRSLTTAGGETALISWSGSMFEYLMPALVMRSFPSTLLDQTYHAAVRRQISYADERGVPWGVSESAYNLRDRHLTYQYRAFGVPDLALKRGLGRDLVIAPYATILAATIDLPRVIANLASLERRGALGPYGFRDALDFTRPQPGARFAVVYNYMAHHIGMSMVALTNALLGELWPRRFHADPMVRSAELLLHERVPRRLVLQEAQEAKPDEALPNPALERATVREIDTPNTPQPQIALLGYLPYTVMISQSGSGWSRYEDRAVTRWRNDGTTDDTGQFCYVKDVARGRVWSTSYQPTCATPDWYRALLATDRVTFHRADGDIETRTELTTVPEDAAEVRRVSITNNGDTAREIEVTSYGEIVLGPIDPDRMHPAFANLFVETEWHEWCTAITATRRPRGSNEPPLYCVHVVDSGKGRLGTTTCETDRVRFLGRGRSTRAPLALEGDGPLSGTTGAVIDPIFALRARLRVEPRQTASVSFTTLVATTRERAFELAGRYHDPHASQRALDFAWTATQIELRDLNISPADAAVFQEIAGHLLYSNPSVRAPQETMVRNRGSQQQLWANGISGDWPILLATIDSVEGLPTLRQLFTAHRYWRRRGMTVDLVILNVREHTYLQELNEKITEAMFSASDSAVIDRPGGVFLRRRDLVSADDLLMMEATARVHLHCDGRPLRRILDTTTARTRDQREDMEEERDLETPALRPFGRSTPPSLSVVQRLRARAAQASAASDGDATDAGDSRRGALAGGNGVHETRDDSALRFFNGFGGLNAEGDYEIRVRGDAFPPAPWANVIANPRGGVIVTERGVGCTWAENAYFYRVTPWHNDPTRDPISDALYLRDDDTGEFWCATPGPVRRPTAYTVVHGAGSSSFVARHARIATELTVGMAGDAPVRVSRLRLTNLDSRPRRISLTAYAEWTLGALREHTQHQVATEFDAPRGAIFARNHFDAQFAGQVAFMAMSEPVTEFTADRREFIGRNGTTANPVAMQGAALSGTTGAAIDPCAALRCAWQLAPGESRELVVLVGAESSEDAARRAVETLVDVAPASTALEAHVAAWKARLGVIRVRTPEPAFDAMLNRWALYQALACRMWARTAVYQSSGAYGFRDQLQDSMAFVYAERDIARQHIVRASARQFPEGDVQHWWHPQSGRGVRTRFSDDLAWLPYVVDHYIRVSGDRSVLDEVTPFLSMRALEPHEHEVYDKPEVSTETASVYEHCVRALRRATTVGAHGLPLIGIGDWNDGMNRVGVEGKGESVWLAWFLVTTLRAFAVHAESRGDHEVASDFRGRADAYAAAVENEAWDGAWYRRAYFDDGTPLGSAVSDECRIDAIAQSWSVISGAGAPERQAQAMRSLEEHLVQEDARIILLLTPPFDKTPNDPGYIKGYLPGVRENGAQYTHAALWTVLATALRGDGDRAFTLFQMLNPLTHAATAEDAATYKVEPYAVCADVYSAQGHRGRGGWTWYTGSASWLYRVGLESILGFTLRGDRLSLNPCIPAAWRDFSLEYRHGASVYAITVQNPHGLERGVAAVVVDGATTADGEIALVDDGKRHDVRITMGAPAALASIEELR